MRRAVTWMHADVRAWGSPDWKQFRFTPDPIATYLKIRNAVGAVKMILGGLHEWKSGGRGHCEDWSRLRAVGLGAAAPQLRTVESKEWGQEDTSRRYPQGPDGAKVVGV